MSLFFRSSPRLRLLFASTADGTVTATASETTLVGSGVGSLTLAADLLAPGTVLRGTFYGTHTTPASPTTVTFRAKLGSSVIVVSAAVTPTANLTGRSFNGTFLISCRTAGATGTVRGQGQLNFCTLTTYTLPRTAEFQSTADVTVDTTGTLAVDLTAQLGAGNSDSYTITNFTLEVLKP